MSILNYFRRSRKTSASLAKERLQIIVSHERANRNSFDFLPLLQQEIINVIAKYVHGIDKDNVKVELQRNDGRSVLELNIALPSTEQETETV